MATTDSKASRQRNPKFPAIDLEEAIKRARVLHDKEPRKSMAPETAATHWGYSVKSSGAQQILSALKPFGLLQHDKARGTGKVRLSDLAHRIILDKREGSEQRLQAIRKAALMPKVYAELWKQAGEDQILPSDVQLEHYLRLERSQPFYEDALKGLIKDFRSTIVFATLGECDIMEGDDQASEDSHRNEMPIQTSSVRKQTTIEGPIDVVRSLHIPLQNDGVATFSVPMTPADHELLTTILAGLKAVHVREPSTESNTCAAEKANEAEA